MIIKNTAISAYQNALKQHQELTGKISGRKSAETGTVSGGDFGETLKSSISDSLKKVNDMQEEKKLMIEEFASGKKQNVHELMITLQKAGLAMSMTSTVRNKLMTAYQEIMRMPF